MLVKYPGKQFGRGTAAGENTGGGVPSPGIPGAISLLSASTQTAPFAFGAAFKQGDIPSSGGIVVTGGTGQATIKNTWPDGSAKFAVIAGSASLAASVPLAITLTAGTASTGTALTLTDLASALSAGVTVGAGAFGSAVFGSTEWAAPFHNWITGHRMSSWIFRKQIGSDSHLVAWLEVRLFAGGIVEVLPWVENGYCYVAAPSSRSATYTFSLNGVLKFSRAIYLFHAQRTPLIDGSMVSYWDGTAYDIVIKHDGDYFQASEMVPSYSTKISPTHAQVTSLPSSFTPLQQGVFESSLGSGGFHNHVCLLPQWDALHVTTTASGTYKALIFQSYSAGRYNYHFRDEDTNRVPNINDSKYDASGIWTQGVGNPFPAPTEEPAQPWSIDHQPAVGYMAYLVTGGYYHLEETQFVAAGNRFIAYKYVWDSYVRFCVWHHRAYVYAATVTPDADPFSLRATFMAILKEIVDHYWTKYGGGRSNPQGLIFAYSGNSLEWGPYALTSNGGVLAGCTTTVVKVDEITFRAQGAGSSAFNGRKFLVSISSTFSHLVTVTSYTQIAGVLSFNITPTLPSAPVTGSATQLVPLSSQDAIWMQDYSVSMWGIMKSLKLPFDSTTEARREEFWLWHAGQVVGRMGYTGSTEFLYRDIANNVIATAPVNQTTLQGPDWTTGAGPWYANWGEVYAATYQAGGFGPGSHNVPQDHSPKTEGPMRDVSGGFDFGDPSTYQTQMANAMRSIAYVVKHDVPGAVEGYGRLTSSSNWHTFMQGMEATGFSQGALAPHATPKWARGLAVGQNVELAGTDTRWTATHEAWTPANLHAAGAGPLDAYCGMTLDPVKSKIWMLANGGHGDYYGNEVATFDLALDIPVWDEHYSGSQGPVVGANNYTDGNDIWRLGYYADDGLHGSVVDGMGGGRLPASGHSYYCTQFIGRKRQAVRVGGWSQSPGGSGFDLTDAFRVDVPKGTRGWLPANSFLPVWRDVYPNGGPTNQIFTAVCTDPTTSTVYIFRKDASSKKLVLNTGNGGDWAYNSSSPNDGSYAGDAASAVDFKRRRIMFTHAASGGDARFLGLDTGLVTTVPYPASPGKSVVDSFRASPSLFYCPQTDAYYMIGSPDLQTNPLKIVKLAADTLYATEVVTTGAALKSSRVAGVAGSGAGNDLYTSNMYNKAQMVPELRGVVIVTSFPNNVTFVRLW